MPPPPFPQNQTFSYFATLLPYDIKMIKSLAVLVVDSNPPGQHEIEETE